MTAARRADQVMPDPVEHATGKTFGWLLVDRRMNGLVRSLSLKLERLVENAANVFF